MDNELFIEDTLSPYEQFQLSRYGNILNNANPDDEPETSFTYPCETEIIYNELNPE